MRVILFFFFQAEDGIRDIGVTGVQTCALPIYFLTPFSVATGISLIFGYGLLGATWCVMKTTGELEIWARRKSEQFLFATVVAMGIVSAWVPFLGRQIEARWFSWPNIAFLAPVPQIGRASCRERV